ncbi:MAG TPA: aminopeptidase [Gemmatimonadaceae bacterium]|nr:aminopeptidase [Gemmatimonadaceae bacterium]
MKFPARIVRRTLLAIVVLIVAFLVITPIGRYLARAGWEEGKILARRRPIRELVASPKTDPNTRAKLELVLDARTFAADSLHLEADESFTTYSKLDSDTLVLVVGAAYRDRLRPYTWWFPIVGRVPYKGYFTTSGALDEAKSLESEGLDTYVRPASAFSTLGWFEDPVVSTTLHEDSASLANTVIHELTHNTFYAPGQAVFNESFANFVGAHGAMRFFEARGDTLHLRESEADWARDRALGAFWQGVFNALDSAFKAHPASKRDRLTARDTVFAHARAHFFQDVLPRLPGIPPGVRVRLVLNNAIVLSRRVYRTGLDLFDGVLDREGGDLHRAVIEIIALAKSRPKDPYGAVRDWLQTHPSPATGTAAPGDSALR